MDMEGAAVNENLHRLSKCKHWWRKKEHFFVSENVPPKWGCHECRVMWARLKGILK